MFFSVATFKFSYLSSLVMSSILLGFSTCQPSLMGFCWSCLGLWSGMPSRYVLGQWLFSVWYQIQSALYIQRLYIVWSKTKLCFGCLCNTEQFFGLVGCLLSSSIKSSGTLCTSWTFALSPFWWGFIGCIFQWCPYIWNTKLFSNLMQSRPWNAFLRMSCPMFCKLDSCLVICTHLYST